MKKSKEQKNKDDKNNSEPERSDKDKHFSEIVKLFLDCVKIQPDDEEFAANQERLNKSLADWFGKYPGSSIADVAYNISILEMFSSEGITYENISSDLVRVTLVDLPNFINFMKVQSVSESRTLFCLVQTLLQTFCNREMKR